MYESIRGLYVSLQIKNVKKGYGCLTLGVKFWIAISIIHDIICFLLLNLNVEFDRK